MFAAFLIALSISQAPAATPVSPKPDAIKAPVGAGDLDPRTLAQKPRIDVAFVLDATGSMGDEIDVVKERIVEITRQVSSGQPRPDVRFGIVAYRDRGDEYITRTYPFTRSIADVQRSLSLITADGGGDEPEAVAEGMYAGVHDLAWDDSPRVARMMFLIGDAGPHSYPDGKDWKKVTAEAKQARITIHTIGCSGLAPWADQVFAQISKGTGGELAHLTYRAGAAMAKDGKEHDVLRAGEKTYVAKKPLSPDEWKKGAEALAKSGAIEELTDSSAARLGLAGPAARADGLAMGGYATRGAGGAGAAAAIAAAPPVPTKAARPSDLNNLDHEIADKIMNAAKAEGVAY
ncbi:MAG: VWA domain-containing protein [Deltaproteobacteria bacterium]|nr:VWA domain-containing protein [Deltaproteobacteria bacterium]